MRTMKKLLSVAALLLLATAAGGAQPALLVPGRALAQEAEAPAALVPYAGQLTDAGGQPVPDGAYALRLELYDAEGGGQLLWAETQELVPVHNGSFSVLLGEQTPLPLTLMASGTRWLAVAVRGPDEAEFTALTPRQALVAVQSAATTAAAVAATGSPACAHNHVGESWEMGVIDWLTERGLELEGSAPGSINLANVLLVRNLASTGGGSAIIAQHLGTGPALFAHSIKGTAVYAMSRDKEGVTGTSTTTHGVYGETAGEWSWTSGVYGKALKERANGVTGWNAGKGIGVYAYSEQGTALYIKAKSGHLIQAYGATPNDAEFLVTNGGAAYADGGWNGAADFAELMEAEGAVATYEPGDVLVVSASADRGVARSAEAYSTAVIGVYSARPGFVGSAHPMEEPRDGELPVAMLGIVPCKVTAENGPIHRGDLLVTASTPGHAMRADSPPPGTVLGKALAPLESGAGVIEIAVTLQ